MARVIRAALGTAVFLVGVPLLLWVVGGDPLRRLPSWSQVTVWFDQPSGRFTPTVLAGIAVWALWLLWAVFALLLATELVAVVTRWRIPALRLPAPLHRLVFGLAGTAAIAVTSAGSLNTGNDAGSSPAVVASADGAGVIPRQAVARGPALIQVADTRYLYTVERHDTLSTIAKEWLGDANRWPEICRLNKHRHFPRIGGTLRDCDLIYPGWDLRLPADARPPESAAPATPPAPPTPPPATASPSVSPSSTPDSPSRTVPPATPDQEAAAIPSGTSKAPSAAESTSPTTSTPTASASPSAAPDVTGMHSPTAATDEHGVQLSPSDWLPWSLAAAISAAAALVWAQRRRRYTGEPDADAPTQPSPPVLHLRRAVARNPELANPDSHEPPALVPDLAPLPTGGAGIVGDGAHAAARATLVAVLASGGPHQPHARGEVIIDAATLETLLGPDARALNPWPRLHVLDSVDDALAVIEARLLHRSRILDEHALTDLDTLRQQAPEEEPLPPAMLITRTPPAGARMRAKVALALGGDLHVSALLLGEWAHGAIIEVAPDGHTTLVCGQATELVPPRMPVLERDTAIQILTTLREAQTGEPPAVASPAVPVTVVPLHASRTDTEPADQPAPLTTPPAATSTGKAQLRVLGQPRIDNITQPGRPLRAKALELAVFLACHPDGATTRDIGEYLEPDARISQADQRVHTNASNLRHVLGRAGTADTKNAYVIKTAGRYRLDPATVDVDVWALRDLLRTATIATGPRRRELLTAACDLYTAPLADGQDYEWLQPHRETVRRWSTEAHLLLADDLLHSDPHAASDLLDKAIGFDRYNEALYTRAMHARHALGDANGIRTLLRALTKALTDLDTEPQEETIALATELQGSLAEK
ncbi:BTAD domain-containing putative transcriptional regulator [Micromonospora sp. H33]|uniref:BTAD domain-containing putative transcriptional regulator n=1 Tax=Micromonospora sp. H33 TaxID=3452215 RepID=UPI003F8BD765